MDPSVEDTLQILQLYARYAHAIDRGDGDGWSHCYTADGIYWSSTFGECTGRANLREFAIAHHKRWVELGIQTRHWNNQVLLEGAGDQEIKGSLYVMLLGVRPGEDPRILLQTVYSDRLWREDGEWRLRERRSSADARPDASWLGFERWTRGIS